MLQHTATFVYGVLPHYIGYFPSGGAAVAAVNSPLPSRKLGEPPLNLVGILAQFLIALPADDPAALLAVLRIRRACGGQGTEHFGVALLRVQAVQPVAGAPGEHDVEPVRRIDDQSHTTAFPDDAVSARACVDRAHDSDLCQLHEIVLFTVPSPGHTVQDVVIEFRIEKVSRRKDGQRFRILVEPDYPATAKPKNAIAGVQSEPINVLSKRKTGERIVSRQAPATLAVHGLAGLGQVAAAGAGSGAGLAGGSASYIGGGGAAGDDTSIVKMFHGTLCQVRFSLSCARDAADGSMAVTAQR